jgi:hypothetical protein
MNSGKWQKIRRVLIGFGVFFVVWTVVALVVPLLPSPWPPFYWALPVHGQVIDAEKGTPLSGVIVVAHWELRTEGWAPRATGQAAVMEDVTDIMGRFTFRWWRPRLRWPWQGHLESDAPGLLFFKSGYKTEFCHNSFARLNANPFPSSKCDGAVIKLKRFQGTDVEYVKQVQRLDHDLEFAFRHHDCSWKKIPHMLIALDQEGTRLAAVKGYRSIESIETRASSANERWCGSIKNYMRSYIP